MTFIVELEGLESAAAIEALSAIARIMTDRHWNADTHDRVRDVLLGAGVLRQAGALYKCPCGSTEFVLCAKRWAYTPILLERRGDGLAFVRVDNPHVGDEDVEGFQCARCDNEVDRFICAEVGRGDHPRAVEQQSR